MIRDCPKRIDGGMQPRSQGSIITIGEMTEGATEAVGITTTAMTDRVGIANRAEATAGAGVTTRSRNRDAEGAVPAIADDGLIAIIAWIRLIVMLYNLLSCRSAHWSPNYRLFNVRFVRVHIVCLRSLFVCLFSVDLCICMYDN